MRFVYQHAAILGVESEWSAVASECAGEQGKFWEYHDKLFEVHRGENRGAFAKANLKRFAAELSLDPAKFGACLDSDKYLAKVRAETEAAQKQGVTGTPTFFINGQKLVGAQPYEQFAQVINIFLKK